MLLARFCLIILALGETMIIGINVALFQIHFWTPLAGIALLMGLANVALASVVNILLKDFLYMMHRKPPPPVNLYCLVEEKQVY